MRKETISIRITKEEKEALKEKAKKWKFNSVSDYLRFVGNNTTKIDIEVSNE